MPDIKIQNRLEKILKLDEKLEELRNIKASLLDELIGLKFEKETIEFNGKKISCTLIDNQQEDGSIIAIAFARRYSIRKYEHKTKE